MTADCKGYWWRGEGSQRCGVGTSIGVAAFTSCVVRDVVYMYCLLGVVVVCVVLLCRGALGWRLGQGC